MTPELFRCAPLDCSITPASCAARHRAAKNGGRAEGMKKYSPTLFASACRECPVGAAHDRGERPPTWADGKPVELVQLGATAPTPAPPTTPPITRIHLPTSPRTDEDRMPEPRMITHNGETLSMTDWAKRLGVSATAIRARIERGWTEVEAVSTLQGEVPARLEAERAKAQERPAPKWAAKVAPPPVKVRAAKAPPPKRAPRPATKPPIVTSTDVAAIAGALDPVELLTRLGYPSEYVGETPAGRLVLVRASAE